MISRYRSRCNSRPDDEDEGWGRQNEG